MATVVHIQETTSTQVTELIRNNTEEAIRAYAQNAAYNWGHLYGARVKYFPGTTVVRRMVFEFNTERLIVRHEMTSIYGHRYVVAWLNRG
jgi:hypothetical protein